MLSTKVAKFGNVMLVSTKLPSLADVTKTRNGLENGLENGPENGTENGLGLHALDMVSTRSHSKATV